MSGNIHVMADESLGGVMREYREVARKATAGEYVRVFGHGVIRGNGIFKVDAVNNGRIDYTVSGDSSFGTPYYGGRAYVTLEPMDVIVVDGEGLRMVNHRACVGDLILVTGGESSFFSKGNVGRVKRVCRDLTVFVGFNGFGNTGYNTHDGNWYVKETAYHVLEPLTAPAASIDSTYELRIQALEKRIAELERSAKVTHVKSPQELRDEIVEFAKKDALDLLASHCVEPYRFVVNREKRTVVALALHPVSGRLYRRGIAKCAPDDVFNVHIGRAIALRRALNLELPLEYANIPNPTNPRTGDVVRTFMPDGTHHATFSVVGVVGHKLYESQSDYVNGRSYTPFEPCNGDFILDDSARDTEVSDLAEAS